MKFIKKWFEKQKKVNAGPVDIPYTYIYNLGELPLPQPWRSLPETPFFLPYELVLIFADKHRLALLRKSEADLIDSLRTDMLTYGIKTPLEMHMDGNGKLRLQEGYHRMCVVQEHPEAFPRVPVYLKRSNGVIRSYGRPIPEEIESLFQLITNKRLL